MTSASRLTNATPARVTCEYSFGSQAETGSLRMRKSRNQSGPGYLSPSIQNLLTGCVKSQYTACIPVSPSNATNVNQEPVLPKGVRNNRMIVEIVPPAAPMPPPMVNPG